MTTDEQPTVVVAEDEQGLADLYAKWVAEEYVAETAYGGHEAVAQIDESVDVVLLDRRMPKLHGDDVLYELRNQGLDCQVAMVTAVKPDFDLIEMPFDSYIVKPVSKADLHNAVSNLIDRRTYSEKAQELITLITKRNLIETEKDDYQLDESDAYDELCERIEELRATVDTPAEFPD